MGRVRQLRASPPATTGGGQCQGRRHLESDTSSDESEDGIFKQCQPHNIEALVNETSSDSESSGDEKKNTPPARKLRPRRARKPRRDGSFDYDSASSPDESDKASSDDDVVLGGRAAVAKHGKASTGKSGGEKDAKEPPAPRPSGQTHKTKMM